MCELSEISKCYMCWSKEIVKVTGKVKPNKEENSAAMNRRGSGVCVGGVGVWERETERENEEVAWKMEGKTSSNENNL